MSKKKPANQTPKRAGLNHVQRDWLTALMAASLAALPAFLDHLAAFAPLPLDLRRTPQAKHPARFPNTKRPKR